jgi:phage tail tape-measure protein
MEDFFRASGVAWSEHLRARQKACMSMRRLALGEGGGSLAGRVAAPSIQLVHGAVVRAVEALLHVVLKEPVLESRPRQTAVEHADADQRARSNGVAYSLQRHLDGREWVRVFAAPVQVAKRA